MRMMFVSARAAVFASGFVLLWAWVAGALRQFDDSMLPRLLPTWATGLGVPIMVAGLAIAIWCIAVFVARGHGTPAPFDPPRKLVAAGPYRYVRNPMYVGGGLALLGFWILLASPSIILFVPVWWFAFHLMVLLYEEPVLRAKFGREYEDYCERTPRWIPRARNLTSTACLPLFLLCATSAGAGGTVDFTGEWKLNVDRSDFGVLPPPERRTDQVRHADPVFEVTSHQVRSGRESIGQWRCRTDGSTCAFSIRGADLKLTTTAVWNGPALVLDSRGEYGGRQVRMSDRWTLSPDGKTLTIARRMSDDSGETHQNLVLEKQ